MEVDPLIAVEVFLLGTVSMRFVVQDGPTSGGGVVINSVQPSADAERFAVDDDVRLRRFDRPLGGVDGPTFGGAFGLHAGDVGQATPGQIDLQPDRRRGAAAVVAADDPSQRFAEGFVDGGDVGQSAG